MIGTNGITQQMAKDLLDCYWQRGKWATGDILVQHEKETSASFSRRKARFVSPNFFRLMADMYDILWTHDPSRSVDGKDDIDPTFSRFCYDAGYGLSLSSFLRLRLKEAQACGMVLVVMDADSDQPGSETEMVRQRKWPYLTAVYPHDLTSLVVDQVGRIQKVGFWIQHWKDEDSGIRYERIIERKPGERPMVSVVSHSMQDDGKGNQVEATRTVSGPVQAYTGIADLPDLLPIIPIVPSLATLVTSEIPPSPMLGAYQLQCDIANNISLANESIYRTMYSLLKIKSDTLVNKQGQFTASNGDALMLASNEDADFISAPDTPVTTASSRIDAAISMMSRTSASIASNDEQQSGIAKQIDRQVGIMSLKTCSGYMEQVEYLVYEAFCRFVPDAYDPGYTVSYFKDFELTDVSEYIANATDLLASSIGDQFKVELRKELARKMLGGGDPETLAAVLNEEDGNCDNGVPVSTIADATAGEQQPQSDAALSPSDAAPVAPETPIANTALNGAQVQSLLLVLSNVSNGSIGKDSAKAVIAAAFPAITSEQIDGMLGSINRTVPDGGAGQNP